MRRITSLLAGASLCAALAAGFGGTAAGASPGDALIPVTGSIDGQLVSGTLEESGVETSAGAGDGCSLAVDVVGFTSDDGTVLAGPQRLRLSKLVVSTEKKAGGSKVPVYAVSFALSDLKTNAGELTPYPITLDESRLGAGAHGNMQALDEVRKLQRLLRITPDCRAVAALLSTGLRSASSVWDS